MLAYVNLTNPALDPGARPPEANPTDEDVAAAGTLDVIDTTTVSSGVVEYLVDSTTGNWRTCPAAMPTCAAGYQPRAPGSRPWR